MGLMDKLTAGIERIAEETDKAIDKGKTKAGELQIEMQMDGLAKKLGYLVFDFYRGREVDQALRQKYLDDLSRHEDRLLQLKAEVAARTESRTEAAGPGDQWAPQTGESAPGATGTAGGAAVDLNEPYTAGAATADAAPAAAGEDTPASGT